MIPAKILRISRRFYEEYKENGEWKEFPCEWLIKKVVWRPNVVEELTELAELYYKGK